MLEPYEGKLSSTVLRGEGRSNAPDLPDQIIENKQRFISQIMTSKTLVRSAEDIDEATLSYAEIKAIATGNPLIKEKMDIDVKLERLKMAKSEFLRSHEQLEAKVNVRYPKQIKEAECTLANIQRDIETLKKNTVVGADGKLHCRDSLAQKVNDNSRRQPDVVRASEKRSEQAEYEALLMRSTMHLPCRSAGLKLFWKANQNRCARSNSF